MSKREIMRQIVIALLLILTLFPAAQAGHIAPAEPGYQNFLEDFEQPNPIGGMPQDSHYTITTAGNGPEQIAAGTQFAPVSFAEPGYTDAAAQVFQITSGASAPTFVQWDFPANWEVCDKPTGGANFELQFQPAALSLGNTFEFRLNAGAVVTTAGPQNSMGMRIVGGVGADPTQAFIRGGTGAEVTNGGPANPVTAGNIYRLRWGEFTQCDTENARSCISLFDVTTQLQTFGPTCIQATSPMNADVDSFSMGYTAASTSTTMTVGWFLNSRVPADVSGTLAIVSLVPNQGYQDTEVDVRVNKRDATNPTFFFGGIEAPQFGTPANAGTTDRIYHVTAPAHAVGAVDVQVTADNYATATATNAFTYLPPQFEGACPNYRPFNFEGFEPPAEPGDVPARCWYDFLPTGLSANAITDQTYFAARTLTTPAGSTPRPTAPDEQSLTLTASGASDTRFNLKNGWNGCSRVFANNEYYFAVRAEAVGARLIGISDKTTNPFADATAHATWISFNPGSEATLNIRNAATTATTPLGFSPSAGAWYYFLVNLSCRDPFELGGNNFITCTIAFDANGDAIASTFGDCADATAGAPVITTMNQFHSTTTAGHATFLDDLRFGQSIGVDRDRDAPVGFNFIGFDATAPGDALIARTSEPANVIRTYDTDIQPYTNDPTNNCNQAHGVMAWSSAAVAWISCGDPDHKHLTIRTPVTMSDATGRSYEINHLGDEGDSGDDEEIRDDTLEIFKLARWPIDYNNNDLERADATRLAFAFSESGTGQVGVFLEQQLNNGDDSARLTREEFAPDGQTVTQICVVSFDTDGDDTTTPDDDPIGKVDFLVAVHPSVGLGVWQIKPGTETGAANDPILTRIATPNPTFSTAQALDCAVDRAYIAVEDGSSYLVQIVPIQKGPKTGDILFSTTPLTTGSPRGVAMGQSGRYGVLMYTYAGDIAMNGIIYDFETESVVNEIAMKRALASLQSSEPFLTARIDRQNNYLYVMYSDDLRRYPLLELLNGGVYITDPDPLNPTSNPKGDMDVGCDDSDPNAGDGIENEDDPNPTDCDADNDGTIDGEDTQVCPTTGGPCYDGTKLQDRCAGVNNDGCNTYKEAVEDGESGITPEGSGKAFGFNLSETACTLLGILMIVLGALGGAYAAHKAQAGGAALPGGGAALGLAVSVWQFCIPAWVVFILVGVIILGIVWMFVRRG